MYCSRQDQVLSVAVRVQPNARRNGVVGLWNGTHLKIALIAPPIDGRANEALIDFISSFFGVRTGAVALVSGQTGRQKRITVTFPSIAEAERAEARVRSIR